MTKRQIIDRIIGINKTAEAEFLARFTEDDLNDYLNHLAVLKTPRLSGDPRRYDAYFECRGVSDSVGQEQPRPAVEHEIAADSPADRPEAAAAEPQAEAAEPEPRPARSAIAAGWLF